MKGVAVFGSTGAIGRNALQVIDHLPGSLRVSALVANRDALQLARQAREFRPECAVVIEESRLGVLRSALIGTGIKALAGVDGLNRVAASGRTDILLMALSGTTGLGPVLTALEKRKRVAIATKEIIVSYGAAVMAAARRSGAEILPIDSELSAIHQCLDGHDRTEVSRIILTASGGPFLRSGDLRRISRGQALKHPTWRMGEKITVDSATLMNKGLEVIETAVYFGIDPGKIEVLVHPQSIVHSLVEFCDGSLLAQLAMPDMRLPIQYALTYPRRAPGLTPVTRLETLRGLSFEIPDQRRFPCLTLATQALREGGLKPCILNAANDVAVQAFLQNRLAFHRIPAVVAATLSAFPNRRNPTLRQTVIIEAQARIRAQAVCARMANSRKTKAESVRN